MVSTWVVPISGTVGWSTNPTDRATVDGWWCR